jgi:hypothetical protein
MYATHISRYIYNRESRQSSPDDRDPRALLTDIDSVRSNPERAREVVPGGTGRGDLNRGAFLPTSLTVSDDGLLAEYLDVTPRRRVRPVPIGGTIGASIERHIRFTRIVWRHDPRTTLLTTVQTFLLTLLCPLFPVLGLLVTVAILSVVYAAFGIRRWTVLLAYPAMIVQLPLLGYALARRTFVRGGRRYRWHGKFDVRVLDEEVGS